MNRQPVKCRCASSNADVCALSAGAPDACTCACHRTAAPAKRAGSEVWGPPRLVHTCFADGCSEVIGAERLMCVAHWRKVPRDLQKEVWRTYVPGQEKHRGRPSDAYIAAARAAITAVAKAEREAAFAAVDRKRQGSLF